MTFTEQPRYWLIPDINGNLGLPEGEQVKVEIIRPTGFQMQEMKTVVAKREFYENDQPIGRDGEARTPKFKNISTEIRVNADYILRSCVGKIKNLRVADADGKNEREIKTGSELAECRAYGIASLVDAICGECASDRMTDSKKKNSE